MAMQTIVFVWPSLLIVPSINFVYFVKAVTRAVEMLLALAVLAGGLQDSVALDRAWSLVNIMVQICHCYFNSYSRVSQG